jgi:plasmid maintenance system antidote protein VapI
MALRIEKAFGVSMDTLMRMQNSYDIAQTRDRAGEIKVAPFKGKPIDRNRPSPQR